MRALGLIDRKIKKSNNKVSKVLTIVDFYSGVNDVLFKQWVFTYYTDNVTHGLGSSNASNVIWNN